MIVQFRKRAGATSGRIPSSPLQIFVRDRRRAMPHCENSAPANGLLLPRKSVPLNEGRLPDAP